MSPRPETRREPRGSSADASPTEESLRKFGRFRKAVRAGRYDALIGHGPRRTLRAAAADTGLEAEVGAIRLALLRLVNEEPDPNRVAAGVARLTAVAVQAARLRHVPDNGMDEIAAILSKTLDEMEQEGAFNPDGSLNPDWPLGPSQPAPWKPLPPTK